MFEVHRGNIATRTFRRKSCVDDPSSATSSIFNNTHKQLLPDSSELLHNAKKDFVCKDHSLQKSLAAGSGVPRPGSLYPKAKQLVPICSYARIKKLDSCSSPTSSLFHAFRDFSGTSSPWPLLIRMSLKEEMPWPSG